MDCKNLVVIWSLKISCSQSDSMSYQCELKLGSNYYNTIHIKIIMNVGEFSIVPISKYKISIEVDLMAFLIYIPIN